MTSGQLQLNTTDHDQVVAGSMHCMEFVWPWNFKDDAMARNSERSFWGINTSREGCRY